MELYSGISRLELDNFEYFLNVLKAMQTLLSIISSWSFRWTIFEQLESIFCTLHERIIGLLFFRRSFWSTAEDHWLTERGGKCERCSACNDGDCQVDFSASGISTSLHQKIKYNKISILFNRHLKFLVSCAQCTARTRICQK